MAEQGGRHDLVAVRLGRCDRLADDLGLEAGGGPDGDVAEEVEHGLAHRGDERGVGGHTESVGNEGTRIAPVRRKLPDTRPGAPKGARSKHWCSWNSVGPLGPPGDGSV